ncbi:hypothetical protein MAA_01209 [Metarhizium robertsii ARSEF 23]|uniref:Uncharacterized protein n=1 Tax=Metarhizium robertsii (strain ARSEF 23 / ATCC MYA-3075) TaxID=655844 RepID=E9ENC3_METRA|nr:uncharacterized protein MAA_01209 [Metarhizium robertsii ARSEF 23]EFZ04135.1 hypothetical protein MAA_01209 [Metarhizium robertsii ARSEF 23]
MKFTTVFGFFSIAAAAAIPEDGSGAASPALSGPAPSGPALSETTPSGPAPSGPALSGPAPSGPALSGPAPSQQAPPAEKLLPWVEATNSSSLCEIYRGNEATCGTKAFCKAYDSAYTQPDSNYNSSKECFEAHRLPWVEATNSSPLCGTRAQAALGRGNQQ